jgi:hypothetical protein
MSCGYSRLPARSLPALIQGFQEGGWYNPHSDPKSQPRTLLSKAL